MGTSANLSQIIRFYADKQKSPFIDFGEFCAYIKKYAEHHVEEQAELVKYLGDPQPTVSAELEALSQKKIAALVNQDKKKVIISIAYFSIQYTNRFKEILENESVPYPVVTDLPAKFPVDFLERKNASQYITEILEKQDVKSQKLYVIVFNLIVLSCFFLPAFLFAFSWRQQKEKSDVFFQKTNIMIIT